jgi:hypothetical protein
MIEPTTAIAEIAFVSDMSGVCSRRDTRRITPSPMPDEARQHEDHYQRPVILRRRRVQPRLRGGVGRHGVGGRRLNDDQRHGFLPEEAPPR